MADDGGLVMAISDLLARHESATARELARELRVERKLVNSALYRNRDVFHPSPDPAPLWSLLREPTQQSHLIDSAPIYAGPAERSDLTVRLPEPFEWQSAALRAWEASSRRGVIEAVTGSGKTAIGMFALEATLRAGRQAVVLVPTVALQEQWVAKLRKAFPGTRTGQLGGGRRDDLNSCAILVCVINSARDADYRASRPQLLVADEVHRYGTEKNSRALDDAFDERLGLSATYERDDGGVEKFIGPYFGETSYRLGYAQAIEQGVLAPFRLALVGADLSASEQNQYDDLTKRMGTDLRVLGDEIGFREPFGEFMKQVERLASDDQGPATRAAWRFTKMMNQRRELLADSDARSEAFSALVPTIRNSQRAIVFGERVDQATALADELKRHGLDAAPIHSDQTQAERKTTLRNFRKGRLQVIVAPRVLDEGIDVPEADLAVVVSTTRSRRQMIQRMGRVLRRKEGGREARFVLIYARQTNEDPSNGAHELFLDEVVGAASASTCFDPPTDPADIAAWLAGGQAADRIDADPIPMSRQSGRNSGSKPTSLRAPDTRDEAVAGHLGWSVERVVDARLRLPRARNATEELKANRLLADRAGLTVDELASWLSAELRASGRTEKQRRSGRHHRQ